MSLNGYTVYDKRKMQDIKHSEVSLYTQYVSYIKNGNIVGAVTFINNNPSLKYKVFNSFNWNRLVKLISDKTNTTDATYDSLEGKWKIDYSALQTASEDFKYIGEWNSTTTYKANNLVKLDETTAYYCIAENTNIKPKTTSGWENYWILATEVFRYFAVDISSTQPEGLGKGKIWFKTN